MGTTTIADVVSVMRSKNAGPFQFSVDLFFNDPAEYALVKESGVISRQLVADLYRVPVSQVAGIHYWDDSSAIKVTLFRTVPAGTPGDSDCYAAQQHGPLLDIDLSSALATRRTTS